MRLRRLTARLRGLTGRQDLESYRRLGVTAPDSVMITSGVYLDPGFGYAITLGERVTLSPGVMVLAHDAAARHPKGYTRVAPVVIEDWAYVGARSIVLPGVTIGAGAVVAAGSVVTHDVPAGALAAGVPARVVGSAEELRARRAAKVTEQNHVKNYPSQADRGDPRARQAFKEGVRQRLAEQGELWV